MDKEIFEHIDFILKKIDSCGLAEKVELINFLREQIHNVSPFKDEPVDFVRWVENKSVVANDYNPNKVAPPEMQLLEVSIINDGYTQPIVAFPNKENNTIEVIDGFHRNRVGKESQIVRERVLGYLPIVEVRSGQQGKSDRIASTIRHNRARGKHQVSAMSEIVIELKNRNWNNKRIGRELGMDEDEILRLCQISGLENLFTDKDFSNAWIVEGSMEADEADELDIEITEEEMNSHKIPLEDDPDRIFHTFDKWESVPYGFFETAHKTMSRLQCEYKYRELMTDVEEFKTTLEKVTSEWKYACEHNLTNKALNRIAWLGQAALAYKYNIPATYSSGWRLLNNDEQMTADNIALDALNNWLKKNNLQEVTIDEAISFDRQIELY